MANKTIDLRVKLNTHATTETLICQYQDASNYWSLDHIDGTGLQFKVVSAGADIVILSGGEITDILWHHVALCKLGDDYGIYLDGVQTAFISSADTAVINGPVRVGALDSSNYVDGYIDEVRIQNFNDFASAPVVGLTDTITVPASSYGIPGGTIIAAVPSLNGFISGLVPVFGDVVSSMPVLSGDLAALNHSVTHGTLTVAQPALSGDMSGTVVVEGPIVASMPVLSGAVDALNHQPSIGIITSDTISPAGEITALSMEPYSGPIEASIPNLTGSMELSYAFIASDMPLLTGSLSIRTEPYIKDISGGLPTITGDMTCGWGISAEMPMFTGSWHLDVPLVANISSDMPTITGGVTCGGLLNASMPSLSGTFHGLVNTSAGLSCFQPMFTGLLDGSTEISAGVSGTLPSLRGSLSVIIPEIGRVSGLMPLLNGSIDGYIEVLSDISSPMPNLSGWIHGGVVEPFNISAGMPMMAGHLGATSQSNDDIILTHVRGALR